MRDNLAPTGAAPVPPQEGNLAPAFESEPATEPQLSPSIAKSQPVESQAGEKIEPPAATGSMEREEQPTPEKPKAASAPKTGMGDVLTADDYAYQRPKRGEIRQGRVLAVRDDGIVVDLGIKREGIIPAEDLQRVGSDVVATLSVGDQIPVYVLRPEDDKEGIVVSWHRARQEQEWLDAQRLHDTGEIWEGKIKGYNRGGLIVNFGKIRGFIPASHITGVSRRMDPAILQSRLAEMVGQTLPLKVVEVDRENRRLIFSERTARREWRSQQRDKLLGTLQEGDHVHGVVSNICNFGVFVDVGGTDGLVHISELSWRRTGHPSEIVKVGDEVEAYVLRVDKERKRIGLSLRLIEPDPWEKAEEKYEVGQVVTGTITKITTFGAFAALDDGIEGLVHISELAEVPPKHAEEVVSVGMVLPLCVVKVDSKRRRMGLSLKRVPEEERARWEEQTKTQAGAEAEAVPSSEVEVAPSGETEPAAQEPPAEEPPPPPAVDAMPDESSNETL